MAPLSSHTEPTLASYSASVASLLAKPQMYITSMCFVRCWLSGFFWSVFMPGIYRVVSGISFYIRKSQTSLPRVREISSRTYGYIHIIQINFPILSLPIIIWCQSNNIFISPNIGKGERAKSRGISGCYILCKKSCGRVSMIVIKMDKKPPSHLKKEKKRKKSKQ